MLVGKDSNGIWVYECNQNYYKDLASDRINGRPKSYFGCGVHLQYHTYNVLKERYDFIVKYTNHAYTESPVYDGTTYHKVGCEDCSGYVRQKHTNVSTSYHNTSEHNTTFKCCGGNVVAVAHTNVSTKLVNRNQHETTYKCCDHSLSPVAHTGTLSYSNTSASRHAVRYSCCTGNIMEAHVYDYNSNNQLECIYCGRGGGNILNFEEEEIN